MYVIIQGLKSVLLVTQGYSGTGALPGNGDLVISAESIMDEYTAETVTEDYTAESEQG